jgi:hypothetical protein
MSAIKAFEQALTSSELRIIDHLTSPRKIQDFIDELAYSTEDFYRCPARVVKERTALCVDGALFAASVLRRLGYPPLIMEMFANHRDDDHFLAVFKQDGHWGAISKGNFVGLRFREPVFRNLRELVLSYFEQYYNVDREKTLRSYSKPLNLEQFDKYYWMTTEEPLELITQRLDSFRKVPVLTRRMIERLSSVDDRTYWAGLLGANEAGLYQPPPKKA